jgi:hypothetical protein
MGLPASARGRLVWTEDSVSEFDKLKDDAEQYAQQHPQQVKEGEEKAEQALGIQQQDQGQQQGGGGAAGDGEPDQSSGHAQ